MAITEIKCAFWGYMFFPVYVKGPFNHQGTWKTIAFGVVVPDREELLKQAFLASIRGHELTSKWNGIILSTARASVMVDGLTWRGMTRKENLWRSDHCVVPKCWEPITHWHSIPSQKYDFFNWQYSLNKHLLYLCHSINFIYACVGGYL